MALDLETVRRIAYLERIRVQEDELEGLAGVLSGILGWIEQLNEVDTSGVEPLASVAEVTLPRRADVVSDGNYPERVLANAPESDDGFFAVPKVVE
ncbi:MAG: Asp-tRNA(Asn)/Glu-tRNA(Gln) amidotransferase subunit GatC [Rhodospirillales bacterium]